jgi:acetyl-CoA carboxylase biotin carboxyl carrier protein
MPQRKSTAKKAAAPVAKSAPKSGAASSNFDLAHIREIVGLMADNDLSYFHFEQKESKLEIRRGSDFAAASDLLKHLPVPAAPVAVAAAPAAAAPASVAPVAVAAAPAAAAAAPSGPVGPSINSPMVGTFYRSAAPGEKSFVNVGDQVDENTTVCIIEAMKVMNEIKAEARGTIARILAEDGKPVQYGQPLFELKA